MLDVEDIHITLDQRSDETLCMDIVGDDQQGKWNRLFRLQKKITDKPPYMSMLLILRNGSAMINDMHTW